MPVTVPVEPLVNASHEVWVMVCIDLLESFHRDRRIPTNLVGVDAAYCQPCNAGVPGRVRDNVGAEARITHGGFKCLVDRADGLPIEFYDVFLALTLPSS